MTKKNIHGKQDFYANKILKKLSIALCLKAPDVLELLEQLGISKAQANSWQCGPKNRHYEQMPDQMLIDYLELLTKSSHSDPLIKFLCREIAEIDFVRDELLIDALDMLILKYRGPKIE